MLSKNIEKEPHCPGIIEQVVIIEANNKKKTGYLKIQFYNKKQRLKRALKLGAMCWGGAIVAIFIPIIHFVLVPVLFLTGIISPLFIYSQESRVLGGEGVCPECQKQLPLEAGSNQWPLTDLCTQCRTAVKVEKI